MALQQRLIESRVAAWNGRISEYAANKTLQMYEFMMLGYLSAILCVVVACACVLANAGAASVVFFVLALTWGACSSAWPCGPAGPGRWISPGSMGCRTAPGDG